MHVLVTGKGTSGSWQIRGEQLGRAIGAEVRPMALDVAPYDLAILVKRAPTELLERLHKASTPIVWDVVDAWPQPAGNDWDEKRCRGWMQEMVVRIQPAGIVAATEQMAQDCERFRVPVLWLPHHARPGLRTNPIRPVRVVGYEGAEHYLGSWRAVVERECAARGWTFVVNPSELADVDIVLALRDASGYAPRNWKSNVKLANAQGSGTPVVCCREAGYLETQCGAERWADTPDELRAAFEALEPTEVRFAAARQLKAAAPSVDAVATRYLEWLRLKF